MLGHVTYDSTPAASAAAEPPPRGVTTPPRDSGAAGGVSNKPSAASTGDTALAKTTDRRFSRSAAASPGSPPPSPHRSSSRFGGGATHPLPPPAAHAANASPPTHAGDSSPTHPASTPPPSSLLALGGKEAVRAGEEQPPEGKMAARPATSPLPRPAASPRRQQLRRPASPPKPPWGYALGRRAGNPDEADKKGKQRLARPSTADTPKRPLRAPYNPTPLPERKPVDRKLVEPRPVDQKSLDRKSAERKPTDPKPLDRKSQERKGPLSPPRKAKVGDTATSSPIRPPIRGPNRRSATVAGGTVTRKSSSHSPARQASKKLSGLRTPESRRASSLSMQRTTPPAKSPRTSGQSSPRAERATGKASGANVRPKIPEKRLGEQPKVAKARAKEIGARKEPPKKMDTKKSKDRPKSALPKKPEAVEVTVENKEAKEEPEAGVEVLWQAISKQDISVTMSVSDDGRASDLEVQRSMNTSELLSIPSGAGFQKKAASSASADMKLTEESMRRILGTPQSGFSVMREIVDQAVAKEMKGLLEEKSSVNVREKRPDREIDDGNTESRKKKSSATNPRGVSSVRGDKLGKEKMQNKQEDKGKLDKTKTEAKKVGKVVTEAKTLGEKIITKKVAGERTLEEVSGEIISEMALDIKHENLLEQMKLEERRIEEKLLQIRGVLQKTGLDEISVENVKDEGGKSKAWLNDNLMSQGNTFLRLSKDDMSQKEIEESLAQTERKEMVEGYTENAGVSIERAPSLTLEEQHFIRSALDGLSSEGKFTTSLETQFSNNIEDQFISETKSKLTVEPQEIFKRPLFLPHLSTPVSTEVVHIHEQKLSIPILSESTRPEIWHIPKSSLYSHNNKQVEESKNLNERTVDQPTQTDQSHTDHHVLLQNDSLDKPECFNDQSKSEDDELLKNYKVLCKNDSKLERRPENGISADDVTDKPFTKNTHSCGVSTEVTIKDFIEKIVDGNNDLPIGLLDEPVPGSPKQFGKSEYLSQMKLMLENALNKMNKSSKDVIDESNSCIPCPRKETFSEDTFKKNELEEESSLEGRHLQQEVSQTKEITSNSISQSEERIVNGLTLLKEDSHFSIERLLQTPSMSMKDDSCNTPSLKDDNAHKSQSMDFSDYYRPLLKDTSYYDKPHIKDDSHCTHMEECIKNTDYSTTLQKDDIQKMFQELLSYDSRVKDTSHVCEDRDHIITSSVSRKDWKNDARVGEEATSNDTKSLNDDIDFNKTLIKEEPCNDKRLLEQVLEREQEVPDSESHEKKDPFDNSVCPDKYEPIAGISSYTTEVNTDELAPKITSVDVKSEPGVSPCVSPLHTSEASFDKKTIMSVPFSGGRSCVSQGTYDLPTMVTASTNDATSMETRVNYVLEWRRSRMTTTVADAPCQTSNTDIHPRNSQGNRLVSHGHRVSYDSSSGPEEPVRKRKTKSRIPSARDVYVGRAEAFLRDEDPYRKEETFDTLPLCTCPKDENRGPNKPKRPCLCPPLKNKEENKPKSRDTFTRRRFAFTDSEESDAFMVSRDVSSFVEESSSQQEKDLPSTVKKLKKKVIGKKKFVRGRDDKNSPMKGKSASGCLRDVAKKGSVKFTSLNSRYKYNDVKEILSLREHRIYGKMKGEVVSKDQRRHVDRSSVRQCSCGTLKKDRPSSSGSHFKQKKQSDSQTSFEEMSATRKYSAESSRSPMQGKSPTKMHGDRVKMYRKHKLAAGIHAKGRQAAGDTQKSISRDKEQSKNHVANIFNDQMRILKMFSSTMPTRTESLSRISDDLTWDDGVDTLSSGLSRAKTDPAVGRTARRSAEKDKEGDVSDGSVCQMPFIRNVGGMWKTDQRTCGVHDVSSDTQMSYEVDSSESVNSDFGAAVLSNIREDIETLADVSRTRSRVHLATMGETSVDVSNTGSSLNEPAGRSGYHSKQDRNSDYTSPNTSESKTKSAASKQKTKRLDKNQKSKSRAKEKSAGNTPAHSHPKFDEKRRKSDRKPEIKPLERRSSPTSVSSRFDSEQKVHEKTKSVEQYCSIREKKWEGRNRRDIDLQMLRSCLANVKTQVLKAGILDRVVLEKLLRDDRSDLESETLIVRKAACEGFANSVSGSEIDLRATDVSVKASRIETFRSVGERVATGTQTDSVSPPQTLKIVVEKSSDVSIRLRDVSSVDIVKNGGELQGETDAARDEVGAMELWRGSTQTLATAGDGHSATDQVVICMRPGRGSERDRIEILQPHRPPGPGRVSIEMAPIHISASSFADDNQSTCSGCGAPLADAPRTEAPSPKFRVEERSPRAKSPSGRAETAVTEDAVEEDGVRKRFGGGRGAVKAAEGVAMEAVRGVRREGVVTNDKSLLQREDAVRIRGYARTAVSCTLEASGAAYLRQPEVWGRKSPPGVECISSASDALDALWPHPLLTDMGAMDGKHFPMVYPENPLVGLIHPGESHSASSVGSEPDGAFSHRGAECERLVADESVRTAAASTTLGRTAHAQRDQGAGRRAAPKRRFDNWSAMMAEAETRLSATEALRRTGQLSHQQAAHEFSRVARALRRAARKGLRPHDGSAWAGARESCVMCGETAAGGTRVLCRKHLRMMDERVSGSEVEGAAGVAVEVMKEATAAAAAGGRDGSKAPVQGIVRLRLTLASDEILK